MQKSTHSAVSFMLLLVASVASGQSNNVIPPEIQDTIAVKYERSPDLPNGVAFLETLRALNFDFEQGEADGAAYWIQEELQIGEAEANAFLAKAISAFHRLQTDLNASTKALACEHGVVSKYNREAYELLQQMYATSNSLANQYFEEMKADLNEKTGTNLQLWMDKRKLDIVHVEVDFEKADRKSGRNSAALLSSICNGAD